MKYVVETGSNTILYMQSFVKIGPGVIIGEIYIQHGDSISIHLFLQNKESVLKGEVKEKPGIKNVIKRRALKFK